MILKQPLPEYTTQPPIPSMTLWLEMPRDGCWQPPCLAYDRPCRIMIFKTHQARWHATTCIVAARVCLPCPQRQSGAARQHSFLPEISWLLVRACANMSSDAPRDSRTVVLFGHQQEQRPSGRECFLSRMCPAVCASSESHVELRDWWSRLALPRSATAREAQ